MLLPVVVMLAVIRVGGEAPVPHEQPPTLLCMPRPTVAPAGAMPHCGPWVRDGYKSIQVNVDAKGCNILGDAANEPSIAISATDPRKIVIGWRQFDSVLSDFRQAGWAYSHDGGHTWAFPGSLTPGVFGSDPVLAGGPNGQIYYLSLSGEMRLFRSFDGGITWRPRTQVYPMLLDKPWMTTDLTDGPGRGHIYVANGGTFFRSTDGGNSFRGGEGYFPLFPTMSVSLAGYLFIVGEGCALQSYSVQWAQQLPIFLNLGCVSCAFSDEFETSTTPDPNPGGLLGQSWVDTGLTENGTRVYILDHCGNPTNLFFFHSEDNGWTWSEPIRVHDDQIGNMAFHWFGMMSVAPNGRIDVAWNDTRNYLNAASANLSELYYTYSTDAGATWSPNVPVSPVFDSHVGWPQQPKLGDYYHMVSDNLGVNVAYAATFNGEQDVYFLRIGPWDCNGNEIDDALDISEARSRDCNANGVPDECEYRADADGDGLTTLADFAAFVGDLAGPGHTSDRPCSQLADTDHDGDVDLHDYYILTQVFTAP